MFGVLGSVLSGILRFIAVVAGSAVIFGCTAVIIAVEADIRYFDGRYTSMAYKGLEDAGIYMLDETDYAISEVIIVEIPYAAEKTDYAISEVIIADTSNFAEQAEAELRRVVPWVDNELERAAEKLEGELREVVPKIGAELERADRELRNIAFS